MGEVRLGRRGALTVMSSALVLLAMRRARAAGEITFGLTPVFIDEQRPLLDRIRTYLSQHLRAPIRFVQRRSYAEVTRMLLRGEVQFAWVCGLPYVRHKDRLRLVAAPVFQGAPLYRSYLIAPADDASIRGWKDLRGKVLAYSDPDSNSGFLYPQVAMHAAGIDPRRDLRGTFFAWAHKHVVEAVAAHLADAGAVDSYVWETLMRDDPALAGRTRVVARSPLFGHPPIVAGPAAPQALLDRLQRALVAMDAEPDGQALLQALNLDGFVPVEPALYDSIARNWARTAARFADAHP